MTDSDLIRLLESYEKTSMEVRRVLQYDLDPGQFNEIQNQDSDLTAALSLLVSSLQQANLASKTFNLFLQEALWADDRSQDHE